MKLSTRIYLLALLLPIFFSGCIKEDMSDCPTGLKVYFTYEPATYARTGINPAEVDRIDLFLFDTQGIFRGVWTDETPRLSPDYFMTIPNPPEGNCRFVAWGGLHGCYSVQPAIFTVGKTTFDEAIMALDHASGKIEAGLQPLFFATKDTRILTSRGGNQINMPLVQAYNTLNLTTENLLANGDTYRFTIKDNNGKYKFDYSFAPDSDFIYTTTCNKDEQGQLQSTLNVLRLEGDRHPVIEITNETKGTILYREDLVKLINAAGQIDYGTTHAFDIHLKFGMEVSVSINGWQVVLDGNIILK